MHGTIAIDRWDSTNKMPQALSDNDLMRQIATGKQEGLQELVRRYQQPVHRFLMRYLDSADDAEQATLNVFIRVWEYAPRFQFRAKVSTWLFRIAVNIARDMHEHRQRRPQQVSYPTDDRLSSGMVGNAEEEVLRRMESEERYAKLQDGLRQLHETDRLLLILYYFEEASYEEMHEITGLSYTVLKTRLSRARQRLRALLEPTM